MNNTCMCMMAHNHDEVHQDHALATTQAAARTCPECGYHLQSGFAFCPNCGMELKAAICPSCGEAADAAWKVCPHCGSERGAVVSTMTGRTRRLTGF